MDLVSRYRLSFNHKRLNLQRYIIICKTYPTYLPIYQVAGSTLSNCNTNIDVTKTDANPGTKKRKEITSMINAGV